MTEKLTLKHFPLAKRIFDILVSTVLLIILSPILLLLSLMIYLKLGLPILFKQLRPGWKSIPFHILKFRSMLTATDDTVNIQEDHKRITPMGKFLRSSSLDELPELWNVLKGDMSLVGPRPLLTIYLDRYTEEQNRRHNTKPGITGWAQVNGRNNLSWEDKFKLDVWYIDHWTFWLDIKILFLTLWKVIRREGISQEGEATTKEWMGN